MNQEKILQRLDQLEILGGLIVKEATMLKQGLDFVVKTKPTRKGLSPEETIKILARAERRRTGK